MSRYDPRADDEQRPALNNLWTPKTTASSDGQGVSSVQPEQIGGEHNDRASAFSSPTAAAGLFDHFTETPRLANAPSSADSGTGQQSKPEGPRGPGPKPKPNKDPRFDPERVRQSWIEHNIDPDKADKILNKPLFGHSIQINEVVAPLVDKTNSLYGALEPAKQQQVSQSILSIGGYAKRTTNAFNFSKHSIGASVDINPNTETKQNHEWNDIDDPLLALYEEVVQSAPGTAKFDLLYDTGLKQLDASEAFNRRFPSYLRTLIGQANSAPATAAAGNEAPTTAPEPDAETAPYPTQSPAKGGPGRTPVDKGGAKPPAVGVSAASESLPTLAEITAAIAAANKNQNADVATQLQLIKSKWRELNAWLYGAKLGKGKLVGMVALDRTLLTLMLQGGWTWGGDWDGKKDFMHFDDPQAEEKLRLSAPPNPMGATPAPTAAPTTTEPATKPPGTEDENQQ